MHRVTTMTASITPHLKINAHPCDEVIYDYHLFQQLNTGWWFITEYFRPRGINLLLSMSETLTELTPGANCEAGAHTHSRESLFLLRDTPNGKPGPVGIN